MVYTLCMGQRSEPLVVFGRDVRLPSQARQAVALKRSVEVRAHDKAAFFVLHPDDYAIVEATLARHREGRPIPVAELLTDDDFAIMNEDRVDDAEINIGILASWTS